MQHMVNHDLLNRVISTHKPMICSTGMSREEEIIETTKFMREQGAQFSLLHCNSSYPAPIDQLNLNNIPAMIERYDCPIGYSGHEYDLEPSAVAVALGATIIERHITVDHNMWGTDHKSSIEIPAMDSLQKRLYNINKMLGSREKNISESEKSIIKKLRF